MRPIVHPRYPRRFLDPLPTNSNLSVVQGSDYLGLDCLDDGTITDDPSLYGSLASVTFKTAADIQDSVSWYIDYDNDGYGASVGGRGDNGSGKFELVDGTGSITDSINIVYVDATNDCVLTNPSVTLSTNETKITCSTAKTAMIFWTFQMVFIPKVLRQMVWVRPIRTQKRRGMPILMVMALQSVEVQTRVPTLSIQMKTAIVYVQPLKVVPVLRLSTITNWH